MIAGVAGRGGGWIKKKGAGCGPGARAWVVGLILAHVYHGF